MKDLGDFHDSGATVHTLERYGLDQHSSIRSTGKKLFGDILYCEEVSGWFS